MNFTTHERYVYSIPVSGLFKQHFPSGGNRRLKGIAARGGDAAAPNFNPAWFEPMVGITNAMSLAHKGIYKKLSMLPAGETWEEGF